MTGALVGTAGRDPAHLPGPRAAQELVTLAPADDPRWHDLVVRHGGSSLFQAPPWIRALEATYGFDVRANVLLDAEGRPTAGVAYSDVHDLVGPRVVSLPFSDYCDPLVETRDEWAALVGALIDRGQRVQLRCLRRPVPLSDDRFVETGRARWHEVAIGTDPDELWRSIDGAARRAVRRARERGIVVSRAEDERDLRAFFDLHLRVRKHKYRLLAQPYRFFRALWDGFLADGDGDLLLARREGTVVAGVLFLRWADTLYYKFNASDPRHLDARPNDLIVWEALQHAVEHGVRSLDFGLSDWDQEGLNRFKRKYATDERTIHLLRHGPREPSPEELGVRRLLHQVTGLFVDEDVPDRITEGAGDALYRYFV